MLPETDAEGARRSVTRVRERLVLAPERNPAEPPLSAGIVTYPHPAVTQAGRLFALVEAALVRGKAQSGGRSRASRTERRSHRLRSQSAGSSAIWFSPRISKCRCGP